MDKHRLRYPNILIYTYRFWCCATSSTALRLCMLITSFDLRLKVCIRGQLSKHAIATGSHCPQTLCLGPLTLCDCPVLEPRPAERCLQAWAIFRSRLTKKKWSSPCAQWKMYLMEIRSACIRAWMRAAAPANCKVAPSLSWICIPANLDASYLPQSRPKGSMLLTPSGRAVGMTRSTDKILCKA